MLYCILIHRSSRRAYCTTTQHKKQAFSEKKTLKKCFTLIDTPPLMWYSLRVIRNSINHRPQANRWYR